MYKFKVLQDYTGTLEAVSRQKVPSRQHRNSHYKDTMAIQPSHLYNVNPMPD